MNLQNICDAIDNVKKLVLIKDGQNICFAVKQGQDILSEMCCLSKMAYPMDGFLRINELLKPLSTLTMFDNGLDISPLGDALQARGIVLCLKYPAVDANGDVLEDRDKSALLHIYDKANNHITLPIYCTFMMMWNPITDDPTKLINRLVLENPGNFTLEANGIITLVNKDGMKLDNTQTQGTGGCCT